MLKRVIIPVTGVLLACSIVAMLWGREIQNAVFTGTLDFSAVTGMTGVSGDTTELATVDGAKTTGKQLAFDPAGNVIASASDIGGGASAVDPLLVHDLIEPFCGHNTLGSQGNKQFTLPWYNAIGTGTSSFQAGSAGKPCIVRLQANSSSTGTSALYLYGQSPRPYVDLTNSAWPNWTATLRATLSQTTNVRFYFGANSSEAMPFNSGNLSGFGISFNTVRSDTTSWRYSVWTTDSETGSANNSGVAVSTSSRVFRIRKTATQTLGFSVSSDGGATYSTEYTICPSGCDLTGTPPTAAVSWWIMVQGNNDAAAVYADVDHFTWKFDSALPR